MKEKIKKHYKKHKNAYLCTTSVIVTAGITILVMKKLPPNVFKVTVEAAKGSTVAVLENSTMRNVSMISSNRQGPPSWVVRCIDTGAIFTSQKKAAEALGISAKDLSKHLNGMFETANGLRFERICMAA